MKWNQTKGWEILYLCGLLFPTGKRERNHSRCALFSPMFQLTSLGWKRCIARSFTWPVQVLLANKSAHNSWSHLCPFIRTWANTWNQTFAPQHASSGINIWLESCRASIQCSDMLWNVPRESIKDNPMSTSGWRENPRNFLFWLKAQHWHSKCLNDNIDRIVFFSTRLMWNAVWSCLTHGFVGGPWFRTRPLLRPGGVRVQCLGTVRQEKNSNISGSKSKIPLWSRDLGSSQI